MQRRTIRNSAVNVALLVVSTTVTLAAVEVVLRCLDKPMLLVCGWKSDTKASELNQLGYRGQPVQYADDDFVIVLLGDSQVQANACAYDWMPERRLEAHLRREGRAVRVFTLGAFGYGQDQELLALREYFQQHRANLVLLWQTPVNDVWNNTFPTLMPAICPPKPTFWLEDGELRGPTAQIGTRLETWRLAALWRRVVGSSIDEQWEERLPTPYQAMASSDAQADGSWQRAWEQNYGMIQLEGLCTDKHHWAMYLIPRSDRVQYGLDLTRRLLQEIDGLVQAQGGRFAVFRVDKPTDPASPRSIVEERVYALNGKYYRASRKQFLDNVSYINEGFESYVVDVTLQAWRVGPEDAHLNQHAVDEAMARLAELVEAAVR